MDGLQLQRLQAKAEREIARLRDSQTAIAATGARSRPVARGVMGHNPVEPREVRSNPRLRDRIRWWDLFDDRSAKRA